MQAEIDARKSPAERNRLGQFATPNALAVDIAGYVASIIDDPTRHLSFADPAIGSGSFFSAALTVWGPRQIKQAVGIELDPAFADAANRLWADAGLQIICGDFTRIVADPSCPSPPDLILANPPYVRHHHLDRADKARLQALVLEMTGLQVNGLAGLYVYFLLLATAWMATDGYAAWLIPSEFMDVNYGIAVKRFLTDSVTLIRVHRFDPADVQFGDALVSSAVVVFKKALPRSDHEVAFTFGGTMDKPRAADCVSLVQLRESRKWTAYPNHSGNDRLTLADGTGPTLADFFRIQRGIATGDNKFFIIPRDEAMAGRLPPQFLRPILPSPRYLKATIIEADDEGYPIIHPQLAVIDCNLPEHVVKKRYPTLWAYLQTAEANGVRDGYLVRKRTPWYKQEQREPSPFLCTYMGRGTDDKHPFRFIYNRTRAIGTNLYLMLYPRNGLAVMLRNHPDRIPLVYELLTRVTAHELRGEGRVYGGGLNKIEPSELGRVSAAPFVAKWPELAASSTSLNTATLF